MRDDPTPPTLRRRVEDMLAAELDHLKANDVGPAPQGWSLSPKAVALFVLGGEVDGREIAPKYFGDRRRIETAVATLATDRALLLAGAPGTGKSRVSEHLAAAICGDSRLLIQGSAGLDETQLRYGWNYAALLANGPSRAALTPTPLMRGMAEGKIVRIEELTRIAPETQDALITPLSEKTLPIPELSDAIDAAPGFNVVATANLDDRGANRMSAALQRRFNVVMLPPPATLTEETAIVAARLDDLGQSIDLPRARPSDEEIRRVVRIFRDLRSGRALDDRLTVRRPSGALSTADAISALRNAWTETAYIDSVAGDDLPADRLAAAIAGAVVRDPEEDAAILRDYADTALTEEPASEALRAAIKEIL